ncbi:hypothetical protein I553_8762 [Mycobacterium xenopi 4042]|uniref:Uncharacterized protein n=1 Tax=Mycobacterium xenopi 4042 TaxID=1299334 RepID=X8CMN1_MYCXE|nr:hypothetical protein I553_8762 [Mycobacterium xenopi 4042]
MLRGSRSGRAVAEQPPPAPAERPAVVYVRPHEPSFRHG